MYLRLCLLMVIGMTLCGQEKPPGRGVNFYTREKEARLGAQLAQEIRKSSTILNSPAAREYVDRIGRELAGQLPEAGWTYSFDIVVDQPATSDFSAHEPMSLPGGYVFVPSSLFLAAENEAEFAGMLAHSIAHVASRHGTRLVTRGSIVNVSSVPMIFIGHGGSSSVPLGFLQFQRGFEREADLLAVQMTSKAGYDPAAMLGYVERAQVDRKDRSPAFSPMPARESRLQRLRGAIDNLPARNYAPAAGEEFLRIKEEVRLASQPGRQAPSLH